MSSNCFFEKTDGLWKKNPSCTVRWKKGENCVRGVCGVLHNAGSCTDAVSGMIVSAVLTTRYRALRFDMVQFLHETSIQLWCWRSQETFSHL